MTIDLALLQATVDKLLRSSRRAESLLGDLLDRDRENMNFRADARALRGEIDALRRELAAFKDEVRGEIDAVRGEGKP